MAEKIQITFLGTSSAVPTATRNHTGIWIKYKNENILIDCGEGTQRQIRKAKLNPCKITRLVLTHLHGDHVFGIPGLFQTLNLNGYNKTLEIYGPKPTKEFIENMFKTFIQTKTIKIKTKINEINPGKVFETHNFEITALPLEHGTPTLGYVFQEKDRLRIDKSKLKKFKINPQDREKLSNLTKRKNINLNGKTIKTIKYKDLTYLEKGRKIAIVLDTELCSNIDKLAKNSDLLICEATYLGDSAKQYKHLTAEQTAKIAKKSKVKELILTHISQRYEFKEKTFLQQVKKIFPKSEIAKDFMKVEI